MNERNRYVILLINGVPYPFHMGWIESENVVYANSVTLSSYGNIPIIMPELATVNLTVTVPMDSVKDRAIYKIAKEVLRVTQQAFATSSPGAKKFTVPFTKLELPWEVQISCAYFGVGIQMACCTLNSFSVATAPKMNGFNETWSIGLTEFSIKKFGGNDLSDVGLNLDRMPDLKK